MGALGVGLLLTYGDENTKYIIYFYDGCVACELILLVFLYLPMNICINSNRQNKFSHKHKNHYRHGSASIQRQILQGSNHSLINSNSRYSDFYLMDVCVYYLLYFQF